MKKLNTWRGWRIWELALLASLCVTLLAGLWAQSRQQQLAEKLIRLHVVAVSDSAKDQATKLEVRDGVLALLGPALDEAADAHDAAEIIEGLMPEIERTAKRISGEEQVSVTLGAENYPTRRYDDFALPAGTYESLRVTLGEGEGHNWWCVVFPPLCLEAAQVSAGEAVGGLTEDDLQLITESDGGFELRFRLLELWGELMERLSQQPGS
jgi:stage II sporulation protein R